MFAKTFMKAALLASYAISATDAIATISTVGNKFFTSNGTQFYMKGRLTSPAQESIADLPQASRTN